MRKRFVVELTAEERETLQGLLSAGKASALTLTRARILLKSDEGPYGPGWSDEEIVEALDVGRATVERLRKRFVERGLEALRRQPQERPSRPRKLDGRAEAHLVALACSPAPEGRACWTLQLLADRLVQLEVVGSVSDETVRRVLKKTRPAKSAG